MPCARTRTSSSTIHISVTITIREGGATQTIPIAISKVTVLLLDPVLVLGITLGLVRVLIAN